MVWKCPPLHLPNWNNLWKWKEQMNANELADELEDWYEGNQIYDTDPVPKAATMLRQQQAEIEALKAVLEQEGIGVGRDLLNGGIALFRKAQEK